MTVAMNWCQQWFEFFPNPPINVRTRDFQLWPCKNLAFVCWRGGRGVKCVRAGLLLTPCSFSGTGPQHARERAHTPRSGATKAPPPLWHHIPGIPRTIRLFQIRTPQKSASLLALSMSDSRGDTTRWTAR